MSYDNTNRGAIFKNEKTKDSQPDYRGKINVDGADKDISLWLNTSKDGKTKFFSVVISEPYVADKGAYVAPKAESNNDEPDDLPF